MGAAAPHVVVVDDEPSIRTLLQTVLRAGLGAQVSTFEGGKALLEAWDGLGPVDLLLVDYNMPGLNGFEVAAQVRARAPQIGIIMLSAVEALLAPGSQIDLCLTKPCPPRTLIAAVQNLLQQRLPPVGSPAGIEELRQAYRVELGRIRDRLPPLFAQAGTPEGERTLRDDLHRLIGTAGSYVFEGVMEAAQALRRAVLDAQPLEPPCEALLAQLDAVALRPPPHD
jgi:CheY-like chemotaxis protein